MHVTSFIEEFGIFFNMKIFWIQKYRWSFISKCWIKTLHFLNQALFEGLVIVQIEKWMKLNYSSKMFTCYATTSRSSFTNKIIMCEGIFFLFLHHCAVLNKYHYEIDTVKTIMLRGNNSKNVARIVWMCLYIMTFEYKHLIMYLSIFISYD